MQINDGTGRGYSAKVSESGRVSVDADAGCLAAAKAGAVYVLTNTAAKPTLTMTSNGGIMGAIVNASSSKNSLVIDSVSVSSGAVGLNAAIFIGYTAGTVGATLTDMEVVSTHTSYPRGSSSTVTPYIWDEATGDTLTNLTGGHAVTRTILAAGGPTELVPSGRIIIAPGGSLGVYLKPATGTPEIAFAIRFYEIDEHLGY